MAQSIVVSQGKSFTVELQSMYGSSAYGWCLSTLPKGIILLGTEIDKAPSPYPIGPVIQKFYFAAVSGDLVMTLEFVLTAAFCPGDIRDTYAVEVQVVPENAQEFVPYGENAVANVKYGYMCDGQNSMPSLKYGYPCGYEDAVAQVNKPFIRKDIPENKPFIRKGTPENKPFIRRDIPENKPFLNEADAMKAAIPYGMVYVNDTDDCLHKYGFPNC